VTGKFVKVLYGTRIGQVGEVIEWSQDRTAVYRGGLLPHLFPGPTGLAGFTYGPKYLTVKFADGEGTYNDYEVETVVRVKT
jgi:hypothetical protein